MQSTLLGSLEILDEFRGLLKESNIESEGINLGGIEARVLEEFFSKDPLAAAVAAATVARGADSYVTQIEPIEAKYGSFWRRIRKPKKDKAFDEEVERVLGSMKNVGEAYWHNINPDLFTTSKRRRNMRPWNILFLGFGVYGGLLYGISLSGIRPETYGEFTGDTNAFLKASPVIAAVVVYGIARMLYSLNSSYAMKRHLNNLRNAAQKTDEFLRQLYIYMPTLSR